MTDELKPCPHCDGPAERMWRYTLPGEGPVRYWVMCPACGASTKAFDAEEEADAAWNARAERTCEWREGPEGAYWETGCGDAVTWEPYGVPAHCPTCGGVVKVVE